jgi:NAD(P)-dependent dehydrogenase (short-subunit alcohol dehydrogenase family)
VRLLDKVVIITGAGAGMGRAASQLFAKEGGKIVVADFDAPAADATVASIRESGSDALAVACDITDQASTEALVARTLETYGRIDVLYNNAGSSHGVFGPLHTLDIDGWERVMRTNIRGTFLCCRAAIPSMLANGGGSIINVASAVGLVGWKSGSALSTAKGGVVLMTKSMALDYAETGLRVNVLCPGSTLTAQAEGRMANATTQQERDAVIAPLIAHHPVKRIADPLEIAYAALFLASDESSFMTGAALPIDGGWTA